MPRRLRSDRRDAWRRYTHPQSPLPNGGFDAHRQHVIDLIGNTPLVRINRLTAGCGATVVAKLEFQNPAHSVKDRIALAMIDAAQTGRQDRSEHRRAGADVGQHRHRAGDGLRGARIKCAFVMPETMSRERRLLLKAYGAGLILTPGPDGMPGAIRKANELAAADSRYFIPQQFENPANPEIHRRRPPRRSGGHRRGRRHLRRGGGHRRTLTGVGEVLKARSPRADRRRGARCVAGALRRPRGAHPIQGIGAGFVPAISTPRSTTR